MADVDTRDETLRIDALMTAAPHTVGVDQLAKHAAELMHEHRIRHLPVLRGGKVVGMVSDRDLRFLFDAGSDAETMPVEEAMSIEVYTAESGTSARKVAKAMAEQKIGSAVVVEGPKVVGIFTTIDALEALAVRL